MEEGEAAGAELKRAWSSSNAEDCTMEEAEYHKRAKVYCGLAEGRSASVISSDASGSSMERTDGFGIASSSRTDTDMFCQGFILNYGRKDGREDDDLEVHIDLTDDLLHMVFSFLNHVDLCRSAMVCRQWRVASTHEDLWKVLNFENMRISIQQFENMCQRYPNATEVNVYRVRAVDALAVKAATTLRNLEVLTIGDGYISENFFQILEECNRLRSVTISDAILGCGYQEIHLSHDRLHELKIKNCRVLRLSIRCPQLKSLSLKRSNMLQAMLNCPLLQHLDIASCHKLKDADIRSAVTSCPLLESLDVSDCSSLSNETLRGIAQACAGLHILNASYCPNISFKSIRLPKLTVLKLHSCELIKSASITWIAKSPALEVLELDNCRQLTSLALHLSCLQSLSLVGCLKFTELNLQSPMLSSIFVSNCPALQRVTITSNALRRLALKKQENLTTLVLHCQSLQEVDLSGCKSLSNNVCDLDGGCPMLKSLILDNCKSLTEVRFCNSSLSSLSLVGCRAVTSLDLKCPRVEQICLDRCDNIETAFFRPVALRSLDLGICSRLSVLIIQAPYMVSLDLKSCGALSEASIICPLLTSLDASFCGQLRDDCLSATIASCPLIESLVLMSCLSIGSGGFSSLKDLQNLTFLDLSYTSLMNLEPIFKSCIKLKVLKLHTCKFLTESIFTESTLEPLYKEGALPALEELDLSYGTLSQTVIDDLLACCTRLTHLSLNGCVNMHDLDHFGASEDTQEPAESANRLLQNLSCVGCPNIRKVLIPHSARFDHLSSLNLSLSLRLKEVDLSCFNLVLLNLSNCSSLEVLKLGCPRLASLFLQSCEMDEAGVEAAISGCCSLETLDLRFCPKISTASMARFRTVCPSLKEVLSNPNRLQNRLLDPMFQDLCPSLWGM
ncbi:F-box/LRR-repeat protein 15 isoform X2 [Raphanus sativus]|uniref:F-box/LRR-repeat protein 15 isoform X2 n=1 Tax=Raphanus sativus TaxID=3726 RepID=A0A6J0KHH1_RAPSA|nr:F-box/LRR-repeat protein 15 isoform X2 [Raphanus sativus]XP_056848613.1 F-box/LRR-repeat protein 15 isoform X2 [Raphanus sativus]